MLPQYLQKKFLRAKERVERLKKWVSPQDMEELMDVRARRSKAVAAFEAWSARARAQATPAAGELTDEEINRLVHELR